MLILILINVQYLQIVVFSLKKGLNVQKQSSSDSHQSMKEPLSSQKIYHSSPYNNFWFSHSTPYSNAIWKTLNDFQMERINLRWN